MTQPNFILEYLHNNFGHIGISKLIHKVGERFYWPNLNKDVKNFCSKCHLCAVNKDNKAPNNAPILPMSTTSLEPFQKVGMDILGPLPEATDGSKFLVVLQDYFTKWPEVIALKTVDSDAIIDWINKDVVPRYGVFSELITDQGVQFISAKFSDYCKSIGVVHKTTSPFHPQTDGMVERFNRSFLNMLRNYVSSEQTDWPSHIPLILYAYRSNIHDAIGVSPGEALQGRKLRLPIDLVRPPHLPFDGKISNLDELFTKMKITRSLVRENSSKACAKRSKGNDQRVIRQSFEIGDLVYWKKPVNKKGLSPKLQQIWQGPHKINSKLSELNYVLTDDNGTKITVHVNNLKLCADRNLPTKRIPTRGRPKKT